MNPYSLIIVPIWPSKNRVAPILSAFLGPLTLNALPQTYMEIHRAPFQGTVIFIEPFLGFHVRFREGSPFILS